eukprot:764554-Hanusia_phi.AAC.7
MYGQTNCWVLPHDKDGKDIMYGCYRSHMNDEIFIVGDHAARNMAYQGLSASFGVADCIARIRGRDLVGIQVAAPLSTLQTVRVLPLLNILMDKGTGIVTSVPSDSPEDFIALRDLQLKPNLRAKYGVEDSWVEGLEPVPVLQAPYVKDKEGEGKDEDVCDCIAARACEEFKVASQNDRNALALAKNKAYKIGFNEGVMVVGRYAGRPVQEVKNLIRDEMIANKDAYEYSEPESKGCAMDDDSGDGCSDGYGDDDRENDENSRIDDFGLDDSNDARFER